MTRIEDPGITVGTRLDRQKLPSTYTPEVQAQATGAIENADRLGMAIVRMKDRQKMIAATEKYEAAAGEAKHKADLSQDDPEKVVIDYDADMLAARTDAIAFLNPASKNAQDFSQNTFKSIQAQSYEVRRQQHGRQLHIDNVIQGDHLQNLQDRFIANGGGEVAEQHYQQQVVTSFQKRVDIGTVNKDLAGQWYPDKPATGALGKELERTERALVDSLLANEDPGAALDYITNRSSQLTSRQKAVLTADIVRKVQPQTQAELMAYLAQPHPDIPGAPSPIIPDAIIAQLRQEKALSAAGFNAVTSQNRKNKAARQAYMARNNAVQDAASGGVGLNPNNDDHLQGIEDTYQRIQIAGQNGGVTDQETRQYALELFGPTGMMPAGLAEDIQGLTLSGTKEDLVEALDLVQLAQDKGFALRDIFGTIDGEKDGLLDTESPAYRVYSRLDSFGGWSKDEQSRAAELVLETRKLALNPVTRDIVQKRRDELTARSETEDFSELSRLWKLLSSDDFVLTYPGRPPVSLKELSPSLFRQGPDAIPKWMVDSFADTVRSLHLKGQEGHTIEASEMEAALMVTGGNRGITWMNAEKTPRWVRNAVEKTVPAHTTPSQDFFSEGEPQFGPESEPWSDYHEQLIADVDSLIGPEIGGTDAMGEEVTWYGQPWIQGVGWKESPDKVIEGLMRHLGYQDFMPTPNDPAALSKAYETLPEEVKEQFHAGFAGKKEHFLRWFSQNPLLGFGRVENYLGDTAFARGVGEFSAAVTRRIPVIGDVVGAFERRWRPTAPSKASKKEGAQETSLGYAGIWGIAAENARELQAGRAGTPRRQYNIAPEPRTIANPDGSGNRIQPFRIIQGAPHNQLSEEYFRFNTGALPSVRREELRLLEKKFAAARKHSLLTDPFYSTGVLDNFGNSDNLIWGTKAPWGTNAPPTTMKAIAKSLAAPPGIDAHATEMPAWSINRLEQMQRDAAEFRSREGLAPYKGKPFSATGPNRSLGDTMDLLRQFDNERADQSALTGFYSQEERDERVKNELVRTLANPDITRARHIRETFENSLEQYVELQIGDGTHRELLIAGDYISSFVRGIGLKSPTFDPISTLRRPGDEVEHRDIGLGIESHLTDNLGRPLSPDEGYWLAADLRKDLSPLGFRVTFHTRAAPGIHRRTAFGIELPEETPKARFQRSQLPEFEGEDDPDSILFNRSEQYLSVDLVTPETELAIQHHERREALTDLQAGEPIQAEEPAADDDPMATSGEVSPDAQKKFLDTIDPMAFTQTSVDLSEEPRFDDNGLDGPYVWNIEENGFTKGFKIFPTQHPPGPGYSNVGPTVATISNPNWNFEPHFVIPTVVNGEELTFPAAVKKAQQEGLIHYPVFANKEAASAWASLHASNFDPNGSLIFTDPTPAKEPKELVTPEAVPAAKTTRNHYEALVEVKNGVVLDGVDPSMLTAVRAFKRRIDPLTGNRTRLTSAVDRPSKLADAPSYHPLGYALDFGARFLKGDHARGHEIARKIQDDLGAAFRVIYEQPHKRGNYDVVGHFHVQANAAEARMAIEERELHNVLQRQEDELDNVLERQEDGTYVSKPPATGG